MKSNSAEKKKTKKQKKLAVQVSNIFQNNNLADTFGELQNYYEVVNIKENLNQNELQTSVQKLMSQRTGEILPEETKAPQEIQPEIQKTMQTFQPEEQKQPPIF